MLLLIDNYDSFVHNLARYFQRLGQETLVVRNDAIDVPRVRELRPAAIVFSPGPCTPAEAGASLALAGQLYRELPMLGVCLGHQAIAASFGAAIVPAPRPVHGQTSMVTHGSRGLFRDLPMPLRVCRYHSLVVDPATLPGELRPTAWTEDGVLMAFEHRDWPVYGVQFHPEAILTEAGYALLANFLRLAGLEAAANPAALATEELSGPAASVTLPPAAATAGSAGLDVSRRAGERIA